MTFVLNIPATFILSEGGSDTGRNKGSNICVKRMIFSVQKKHSLGS